MHLDVNTHYRLHVDLHHNYDCACVERYRSKCILLRILILEDAFVMVARRKDHPMFCCPCYAKSRVKKIAYYRWLHFDSVSVSVGLFVCLSLSAYLSVCLCLSLSFSLSGSVMCLSVCLCLSMSFSLSVSLSVSVCLSVSLFLSRTQL